MAKLMLGFDIGVSDMKVVQWDGHEITHALRYSVPENLVKGGIIVSYDAMADFIKESLKGSPFKGKNSAVILPGSFAFLRNITMPAMTVDQLQINLPYEFRDFLDMGKDKYFYDYAVRKLTMGEDGVPTEMDLVAAAVPKEVIESYRRMFRRAGLRLQTAMPAEGAYANLLGQFDSIEEREFAILDAGHTATRLDIYTGQSYETTRVADIGLSSVDKALADAFSVDEHIARAYKESNHQGAQEQEVAQSVYLAIATEVRKAVNFYGFSNRESNLQDVWLCGGGVNIPAFRRAVAEATNLQLHPIQELYPPMAEGIQDAALFAGAIGAAIQ